MTQLLVRELKCGCIPGFKMCREAQEIWKQYEKSQPDSISALVLLQKLERHIGGMT